MALLQLPQKRTDGIEFIDQRSSLYYSKYTYRARVHCSGITLCWFCKDETDIQKRANKHPKRWKNADVPTITKFFNWKSEQEKLKGPNKKATVRIEGNVASVFSNDLDLLKTLGSIGAPVDYTIVDESVPQGTKYFVNQPKYKFRLYLKAKRVPEGFSDRLASFFKRYEGTSTKMSLSPSLKQWLKPIPVMHLTSWATWKRTYCSSNFFVDYNDESTLTLFTLMFDGMIHRTYKLEKRPD